MNTTAPCTAPRSYVGVVLAPEKKRLLGGVHRHESARFATDGLARAWVHSVVEGNRAAGRAVGAFYVKESRLTPEITLAEVSPADFAFTPEGK